MAGTLQGTDRWFNNPASQVSAHYGIGLSGEIHQYVQLQDAAWANGVLEAGNTFINRTTNPNYLTVSIETEDLGAPEQPVSVEQYMSCLQVCRSSLVQYPSIQYLITHNVISPRSRPNCPGPRWTNGKIQQLAKTLNLEVMI